MNSTSSNSTTLDHVISRLRAGRDQSGYETAVGLLWEKYFLRMMLLARKKLAGAHNRAKDEEDIAVSAFKSFCAGMQAGKYEHGQENDLWPLLVTITINKSIDHLRHENRAKRGGRHERSADAIEELITAEATPELQLVAHETLEQLFAALDNTKDPSLRILATLRLNNEPPAIIAQQLGCTLRTIQRKLKTIQAIWQTLHASATKNDPIA